MIARFGLPSVLPAAVRARIDLLRERARAGLAVTCGGVSMEPAIARGDVVMVRSGWPRTGDVAAFVTPGGTLELHRLLAHVPVLGWWVHGGDNQVAPDLGLVHRTQLVGVAVGYWREPGLASRARAVVRVARAATRIA